MPKKCEKRTIKSRAYVPLRNIVGGEQPRLAMPTLCSQKGSSRDPAAMEEMCAKVTPTHSRLDTAESDNQWSDNIVFYMNNYYYVQNNIIYIALVQW